MNNRLGMTVVVVGAGIVGSAVAYRLGQLGAAVTLVDRAFAGAGTSGATFSWLNSFDKHPRAYHQLNLMGIAEHRALAGELDVNDCVHFDGGLMWERVDLNARQLAPTVVTGHGAAARAVVGDLTTELATHGLAARIESCRRLGYLIEELSPKEAQTLEPEIDFGDGDVPVVYAMPNEGWIDARGLAHRLSAAACARYGAKLTLGTDVVRVDGNGSGADVVLGDGTRIACDVAVNAAGPEGGRLAAASGVNLPVERSLGVMFVTSSAPVRLRHVVHAPGVTMRPDGATRVMVRVARFDSQVEEGLPWSCTDPRCSEVVAAASTVLPNLRHATIESVRVGVRPIPGDGVSIVGATSGSPHLYHVITHSGATLGPVLGRLVASDLLLGSPPELASFRPERFADSSMVSGHR